MKTFVKKFIEKKDCEKLLSIIITENEIEIEINEITRKEKSTIIFNKNEIYFNKKIKKKRHYFQYNLNIPQKNAKKVSFLAISRSS